MQIEKRERNKEIYLRKKKGESYRKLAEIYNLSHGRIQQIFTKGKELERYLSTRNTRQGV